MRARGLRSRRPFRQGAGQRAGDLSARRAVPDRRGHALSVRAGDPAARRAAARARAGAARPLRPLRLGARLSCRATATTATCASAIGDYLADVYQRPRQRLLSVLPGRAAGARALHHRPRRTARRPIPTARRSKRRSAPSCAPGPTRSRDALARGARPGQGARAVRALSRRVLRRLSRGLFAARRRSPTSASSKACRRSGRSASTSIARRRRDGSARRAEGLELRPADPAVGARAGAREHGLPGRRRADLSTIAPASRTSAGIWLHDMALERADGGADRSRRASRQRWKPASSW